MNTIERVKLEAVLIGNAAAALHGAPVTTIDLHSLIRRSPGNTRKLKALADELEAIILRPFEGVRARSAEYNLSGQNLRVAALSDVVASKKVANRPSDRAVLAILEKTRHETSQTTRAQTAQPRPRSGRAQKGKWRVLIERIRELLSKPVSERTHFLRKKIGLTATAL